MPIYPCVLIFVTGKLNLFSKKFIILITTILFRQFWSFWGFAALLISTFRCPKDLDLLYASKTYSAATQTGQ